MNTYIYIYEYMIFFFRMSPHVLSDFVVSTPPPAVAAGAVRLPQ